MQSIGSQFWWPCFFRISWILSLVSIADPALLATESFRTSILPILTKAGCNAGACHGAATGQGGFRLSLLGYDPEEDHLRITRELGGRRVDLNAPTNSLLLRKPSGEIDHEGGRRLKNSSSGYALVRDWIDRGAPYGSKDVVVSRIEVSPAESFLESESLQKTPSNRGREPKRDADRPTPNAQPSNPRVERLVESTTKAVPLRVVAFLSNGTQEDVTALALITSNDEAVAEVLPDASVRMRSPGVASVMVRYSGQVAAARFSSPFASDHPRPRARLSNNLIDDEINKEQARLRVSAAVQSEASEFLRRIYLDLIGRLPSTTEALEFLHRKDDRSSRGTLIDRLLAREEFTDFWTLRLGDWLLVGGKRSSAESAKAYQGWLRGQVSSNVPVNTMVRTILTSRGDMATNGPANFFALATDPRDLGESVGSMFLGAQIACARCHAHPADRWTQGDYYHFAAWLAGIKRDGNVVRSQAHAEFLDSKGHRVVTPRVLGGSATPLIHDADRLVTLAHWIASPENPFFSQAFVNRIWNHLMGRGLFEPVDDLRPTNPATFPALLDRLAFKFRSEGFDMRGLIRTIVLSRAYQRTSRVAGTDLEHDRLYARAVVKDIQAQVFADAIAQVTGVADQFEGHATGTRAVTLIGSRDESYAMDVLGRCSRERRCETSGRGGGLAQALHLINGSSINSKLEGGVVGELMRARASDREIVKELYLRAYARLPGKVEIAEWSSLIGSKPSRSEAVQDLLWTLLNSREFAFNH